MKLYIRLVRSYEKYVLVGTRERGTFGYICPLTEELSDCAELSAVCDPNEKRHGDAITYDFDARGLVAETNAGSCTSHDVLHGGGHGGSDHIMREMLIRGGYDDRAVVIAELYDGIEF